MKTIGSLTAQSLGEAIKFLETLFGCYEQGWMDVRYLPSARREWYSLGGALSLTRLAEFMLDECYSRKQDVYVGVLPRDRRGRNVGKEDVNRTCWLWCDVDAGIDDFSMATALWRAALSTPEPNMIVGSGSGLHLYWRLDTSDYTISKACQADAYYETVLKGIVGAIGGEPPFAHACPSCAERARILRVPGTVNWKNPHAPLPVRLIHTDLKNNLWTLDKWYETVSKYNTVKILAESRKNGAAQYTPMFGQRQRVLEEIHKLMTVPTPVGERHKTVIRLDGMAIAAGCDREEVKRRFCKVSNFLPSEYDKIMDWQDRKEMRDGNSSGYTGK